jgi:RNA polymerase sigma-70 factor (ECF subfamily)
LKQLSDEKLMSLVQLGKLNYMELLFVRYQKQLFNYFLKCTFDREASQDLTQNTFVRVLKYRKSFKNDRGFRIWLFQIARNQVKDHFGNSRDIPDQLSQVDHLPDPGGENLNEERMRNEEKLYKALGMLPQDKRELLVMTKFQGMKYEEIAKIRDQSISAIKVQVHRTIAQLRKIYFEDVRE